MKRHRFAYLALLGAVSTPAFPAYMADFTYDYTQNAANRVVMTFKANNTSDGASTGPLDYFQISLDGPPSMAFAGTVTWQNSQGWTAAAGAWDPGFSTLPAVFNADDSLFGSNGGGIAQGGSKANFQVSFDYSGFFDPAAVSLSWLAEFGTSDTDNGGIPAPTGGYWFLGEANGLLNYEPAGPGPAPAPRCRLVGRDRVGGAWRRSAASVTARARFVDRVSP